MPPWILFLDSDLDGMPDGWEFAHGLDPTDPFDASRDADDDGVSIGETGAFGSIVFGVI